MEIRNIKLLVQDTGKFQIPDEKGQGRDSPREHGRADSSWLTLPSTGQPRRDPSAQPPAGQPRPSLTWHKAAIQQRIPSFLHTSADRGARALDSLTSNSALS